MVDGIKVEHFYNVNKRYGKRVQYKLELYYPCINDKSIYKSFGDNLPIMEAENISESGICFKSRVPIEKDDFISFSITFGDNPSFWCLAEVKWVTREDESYLAGCEFISLDMEQINIIREYVSKQNI